MWFLIKSAFWFGLVLVLLPLTRPGMEAQLDNGQQVHIGATVAAATSALDDLTGLCSRRPDVCKTGGAALGALGARARDGALIAYEFLDSRFGSNNGPVVTGAVPDQAFPARPQAIVEAPGASDTAATANIPVPSPAPRRAPTLETHAAADANPAILPKPYSPPLP